MTSPLRPKSIPGNSLSRPHRATRPSPRTSLGLTATVTALAIVVAVGSGCAAKKSLDKTVDKLVKAALANDYEAFKEMSHPALLDEFPKTRFAEFSAALNRLGALKDRTMKGIKVHSGGVRRGTYALRFEHGRVKLKLTLTKGKLTAFRFTGEDLLRALKAVRQKKFGVFKVGAFRWLTPKGKPKANNIFPAGKLLRFAVEIWGLKRAGGNLGVQVHLKIAQGAHVFLDKPTFFDSDLSIPAEAPPVATVTGQFTPKRPGLYTMTLRIKDKKAGHALVHQQAFQVTSPSPTPPSGRPTGKPDANAVAKPKQ